MIQVKSISLSDSMRLIQAAEKKAHEISSPSNIAVVDVGASLLAFVRMDNAPLGSIYHAQDKAFTSCALRSATINLSADAQPGGSLYGLAGSIQGRVITFAGGIPLLHDGQVIGAIGISGGSADQDQVVAEAAVQAF